MSRQTVHWIAQALALLLLGQGASAGRHELRLIEALLNPSFNSLERPAESDHMPLKVVLQVSLQQIIDVDEKNQMIHTNLWLTIKWTDYKLKWNPEDYGNISDIRLPVNKVWKPDILMYNSADTNFDGTYPTNVVVYSTGEVEQIPPGMFTSSCPIEIRWFPFDDQRCKIKFGSWTYDGSRIDLQLPEGKVNGNTEEFSANGEWELIGMPANRTVQIYDCCPNNPFIDITFTMHIRRRKLYYMVNIVVPCLMLSALTLLTFLIPPEAGEKISFGVTILLSLTVFLLLVAEALPATSDAVPLIALYFTSVMLMNALSVVFTVLVLVFHFRTGLTSKMPGWVKHGICTWLAWILRMERPGTNLESMLKSTAAKVNRDVRVSKSNGALLDASLLREEGRADNTGSPNSGGSGRCGATAAVAAAAAAAAASPGCAPRTPGIHHRKRGDGAQGGSSSEDVSMTHLELQAILRELQYITKEMRKTDRNDEVSTDWKFASTVIDRLLLWLFTIVTVVATLAILLCAPNISSS